MRRLYDPTDARRLLNPGPVGIVTTAWRGMTNGAPMAWMAPLAMEPPLIGLAIHPHRHTADMIRFSEELAINIPGPSLIRQTAFLGSLTGLDANKLEAAGLELFRGLKVEAPLIEGCLAWIECGVEDAQRFGDHTLFVARAVAVHALDEAYAGAWLLDSPKHSPLAYLGGPRYAVIGHPLEATFEVDVHGALVVETAEERERREEEEGRRLELERLEGEQAIERLRAEGPGWPPQGAGVV
jgi:flavin reductase (DIM6/NTAB) family NADH-FMN oxidoreductase RutF